MDFNQALTWINKATEMRKDAFWMFRAKAEIQAALGNYKKAIATAMLAKQMAEKAGNAQYVKFNEDNIAKWKKK